MSSFSEALREKISLVQDEKEELEDSITRITGKLEILQELLDEEEGKSSSLADVEAPPKRKPGRPRKKVAAAMPAVDQSLLDEAAQMGGTEPTLADAIRRRTQIAAPRPPVSYGPGVHVGTGRPSPGNRPSPVS